MQCMKAYGCRRGIRRGAYRSCSDKCRLTYKTTNMLSLADRCSLGFFTASEDLSVDYN